MSGDEPEVQPPASRPWRRRLGRGCAGGLLLALGSVAWLSAAVDRFPADTSPRASTPLPAEVRARFDYPEAGSVPPPLVDRLEVDAGGYEERFVQLWVTTPGDPARHKVQILDYRPKGPGRRPAVLVTPIFGARQPLARRLGPALARRGLRAAIVLRAERYLVGDAPPERLERVLRTAVIDRRRTLDWLAASPEVDPARLGALGVSLGGLGTALVCAVDSRVKAAVLVLAGGELETLIPASEERRAREFVAAWEARGVPREALGATIRAGLRSDPALLASSLDPSRLLFVTARRDRAVPYRNQLVLWEAAGRPERICLPTGHASSGLYVPWLVPTCLDWLEERLNR